MAPTQLLSSRLLRFHVDLVLRGGRLNHGKRGIHGGFRDAAEWQSSGGLELKQGGIDESARARAECLLEPIPPSPGLAVGRICLRQIRVDAPQLGSYGRAARDTGNRSIRNIAIRCHGAFSGLPKDRTSDRSHRRSSIASADQVPSVKFPLRAPRGAPRLKPPCKRHRLRPRMAGHLHGGPARVLASHLGARLRFPSRVLMSWSMGLFASFFAPGSPGAGIDAHQYVSSAA